MALGGGVPLDSHEHMELKGLRSSTKKTTFRGVYQVDWWFRFFEINEKNKLGIWNSKPINIQHQQKNSFVECIFGYIVIIFENPN